MYTEQEMTDFLVANFIHDVRWIGNLLEDTAKDNYLQYIKRKQSFTYIFSNEVEKLFNSINDPKKAFSKDSTSYPTLITSILSNEIGYDTAAVMNYFFDYVPRFDRELGENDVIWSNMRLLILKIFPFIEFDRARIKSIIKEAINS
jgi:hypothetical protein